MGLIPYSRQNISDNDVTLVNQVMNSDFLTQGPMVEEFENELSSRFGVEHAVVCSSGTAALHLSYASAGVKEGSLGIVPAITFRQPPTPSNISLQKSSFATYRPKPD